MREEYYDCSLVTTMAIVKTITNGSYVDWLG